MSSRIANILARQVSLTTADSPPALPSAPAALAPVKTQSELVPTSLGLQAPPDQPTGRVWQESDWAPPPPGAVPPPRPSSEVILPIRPKRKKKKQLNPNLLPLPPLTAPPSSELALIPFSGGAAEVPRTPPRRGRPPKQRETPSELALNTMLLELMTAGTDTSSSTVEWTLAELMKNPDMMKKAKEEVAREVKQEGEIRETHLPQLSFLQACIKETMRLHPAVPFLLPHRAVETCEIMNYTVPKDTKVVVNLWSIGRDPKYWEDPLCYKPERFLNSSLDFKGNDFEFLPFGAGRRICPGLPMAARHVPLILASLLHFFDWSLPEGCDMDMDLKFGMITAKQQPLILVPKARK